MMDKPSNPRDHWISLGYQFRKEHGIDSAQDDKTIRSAFFEGLVKAYWDPVFCHIKEGDEDFSYTKMGKLTGINKSTLGRWNATGPKWTDPALSKFLSVLGAYDISIPDCVEFPPGLEATIEAYKKCFDVSRELVNEHVCESAISNEEVLCLHFIVRSRPWLEASLTDNISLKKSATLEVRSKIEFYEMRSLIEDYADIERIVEKRRVPWLVVETAVDYEWFD